MEKTFRFELEISPRGKVNIMDGKGKPVRYLKRAGDPTKLKFVPILIGIPKSVPKASPADPDTGGGCGGGCYPGWVNGRWGCVCP
jgi:hypothetical protein